MLKLGAKCPDCDLDSRKLSIEEVDSVLDKAGFTRESEYTGSVDKITLKHNYCGHVWDTVYSYIQQGSGCPACNKGFGYIEKCTPETTTIYILKLLLEENVYFKVGVTTRSLPRRITELRGSIKRHYNINNCSIIKIFSINSSGADILNIESAVLSKYSTFSAREDIEHFVGYTETFISTLPILEVQNLIIKELNNG